MSVITSVDDILNLTVDEAVDLIQDEINLNIRGVYAFDAMEAIANKLRVNYTVTRLGNKYRVSFSKVGVTSKPIPGSHEAEVFGQAFRVAFLRWWLQL
jgi:hypothetical protein